MTSQLNKGSIESVRGSVADVFFPEKLPGINSELRAGSEKNIVIEVMTHLDERTVRGIALNATRGVYRGMPVFDLGRPLNTPVGKKLLGRMLNVFGETIDRKEALSDVEMRSIHRDPVPLQLMCWCLLKKAGRPDSSAVQVWARR